MASANKKFTPLKKCACNLHEPQHIEGAVICTPLGLFWRYIPLLKNQLIKRETLRKVHWAYQCACTTERTTKTLMSFVELEDAIADTEV
jgi:hypothetical protein